MGHLAVSMTNPLVVVMTRAPDEGQNKTRLHPRVGWKGATALHRAMLTDVLDAVQAGPFELRICVAGDPEHPFFERWRERAGLERQTEGDLGERLRGALRDAARRTVIALGSDAPTLPLSTLRALATSPHQLTIIPARDGGYVGIALNGAHWKVFEDIAWSTNRVFEQTLERAHALGLTIAVLPEWYDIDEPSDLDHLITELATLPATTAPHTRAALKRWLPETSPCP